MINDDFYIKLGISIKEHKNMLNMTQQELADKIGTTLNHIGKIEVAYSKPSLPMVISIASALDVTVAELCDFKNIIISK